jgi:hypothetical protein
VQEFGSLDLFLTKFESSHPRPALLAEIKSGLSPTFTGKTLTCFNQFDMLSSPENTSFVLSMGLLALNGFRLLVEFNPL